MTPVEPDQFIDPLRSPVEFHEGHERGVEERIVIQGGAVPDRIFEKFFFGELLGDGREGTDEHEQRAEETGPPPSPLLEAIHQ